MSALRADRHRGMRIKLVSTDSRCCGHASRKHQTTAGEVSANLPAIQQNDQPVRTCPGGQKGFCLQATMHGKHVQGFESHCHDSDAWTPSKHSAGGQDGCSAHVVNDYAACNTHWVETQFVAIAQQASPRRITRPVAPAPSCLLCRSNPSVLSQCERLCC